jgi:RNA polymerase sigma-70 factor (ECF subfamily)
MSEETSFDDLMARLRAGDQDAAAQVFRRYAHRLLALARSRLQSRQVLQKVGPEDVLQSVFRSFFHRYADGQFDLGSWENLWSLLTSITLHKCGKQLKYFHALRRDVRQEVGAPPVEASDPGWELLAQDPSPLEVTQLLETVEQLLRGLDERDRQIVELRLQEYTVQEIGLRVGRTERTVQRVLERVRKRLERIMRAAEEDGV